MFCCCARGVFGFIGCFGESFSSWGSAFFRIARFRETGVECYFVFRFFFGGEVSFYGFWIILVFELEFVIDAFYGVVWNLVFGGGVVGW